MAIRLRPILVRTKFFEAKVAAATGLVLVLLVETLTRTGLVREDAAIGLTFPALFSIGVILISRYASDVHLDVDAVLLGELAFAPFDRLMIGGTDLGPRALAVMAAVLILNLAFILVFYKELKLATFDTPLAAALGFSPIILNYFFMGLVSVTAVGAFDAVGSILVVALMVGPAAAAYLLTDRLAAMLVWAALLGVAAAIGGYWVAHWLEASIAGSMAAATGMIFALAFIFAPRRGLVAAAFRRARQKREFPQLMLALHLAHHSGRPEEPTESRLETLHEHLHWDQEYTRRVISLARRNGLVDESDGRLILTDRGRQAAQRVAVN